MTRRARRDEGFTLVELLMAMLIGGIVLTGVATLMDVTVKQSAGIVSRTDATQRGRLALDQMTQQLRSQVCVDTGAPSESISLVSAESNAVTFYADLSDGSRAPGKRELRYDPAARTVTLRIWPATTAAGAVPTAWSSEPTSRALLDDVTAADGVDFFRFYGYTATDPPEDTRAIPAAAGPLPAADRAKVARIAIAMDVRPAGAASGDVRTRLEDSVHLRQADPNARSVTDPTVYDPNPSCL